MKFLVVALLIVLIPLFSIAQSVEIEGALIISESANPPVPGMIRWNGFDFEGWNGAKWTSLTNVAKVEDGSGNYYTFTAIGTQTWLDQNLHTTKYNDGTDIPLATNVSEWQAATQMPPVSPIMCWFNDDRETNEYPYGALYTYYTIDLTLNGGKNVCPIGYHVPDQTELNTLKSYLDGMGSAGGLMKVEGTVYWNAPNTGGNNASGFAAYPAGRRGPSGTFAGKGGNNYLRTTTEVPSTPNAFYGLLSTSSDVFSVISWNRGIGMSIRCLQD